MTNADRKGIIKLSSFPVHFQFKPPEYRVENMATPTVLFAGAKDKLADPKDVEILKKRLSNIKYFEQIEHWNHLDFLFGIDAPELLYSKMLDIMETESGLRTNITKLSPYRRE